MVDDKILVQQAQEGSTLAYDTLLKRYSGAIRKVCSDFAKAFNYSGFDIDDLWQEASIAFIKAVKNFDFNKYNSLYYYAERCMKNKLLSLVRKRNSRIQTVPLELCDKHACDTQQDPCDILSVRQKTDKIMMLLEDILNPLQLKVWKLYFQNYSYAEIAEELSLTVKKVDNVIFACKKKIIQNQGLFDL